MVFFIMPRASRYLLEGYTYHLTHRCHDRRFLLRFRQERDAYREWLRIGVRRHRVSVYAYCLTSNHVHVVVEADDKEAVARLMQLPSGVVGKSLNRRKGKTDSVWEHPYQCTMIENGTHLLHCLRYVDLNMVRAGKVNHPRDWRWCGYDELTGKRQRYRILDIPRLVHRLNLPNTDSLFKLHEQCIADAILNKHLQRQAHWTEALAVGSQKFVSAAESLHRNRRRFECCPAGPASGTTTWMLRETPTVYMTHSEAKSEP